MIFCKLFVNFFELFCQNVDFFELFCAKSSIFWTKLVSKMVSDVFYHWGWWIWSESQNWDNFVSKMIQNLSTQDFSTEGIAATGARFDSKVSIKNWKKVVQSGPKVDTFSSKFFWNWLIRFRPRGWGGWHPLIILNKISPEGEGGGWHTQNYRFFRPPTAANNVMVRDYSRTKIGITQNAIPLWWRIASMSVPSSRRD